MSQAEKTSFPSGDRDIFSGGGEMGALLRAYDWSNHPLGDPARWPRSLKTGLRIILNSGHPMFIWWSEAFYMFHNDPYLPALGSKHPQALGARARDMWREIWEQLGVIAEGIFQGGEQFYAEDLLIPLERKGFLEETYWTFSYSPMPDDDGSTGGIFCACSEVTGKVLSQRRLKTLKDIADATTVPHASVEEFSQKICDIISLNSNDIPVGLMYLLDAEAQSARLVGKTDPLPPTLAPETIDITHPADAVPWPLTQVLHKKQPAQVKDLASQSFLPDSLGRLPFTQAEVIPLLQPDKQHVNGFLVLGISPQLEYNDDYRSFHDLLVNQVTATLGQVQARQEAERRQAKLRALFEQAPVAIAILRGPAQVVELINPTGAEVWSINPAEVLDRPLFEALPEARGQGFEELLNGVLRTGEPFVGRELPITLKRKGRPVTEYFNFVYHPWRDEQSKIIGVICVAINVTEQVQAHQEVERQRTHLYDLFQQAPVAIAILQGPQFIVELANPGICELWGRKLEELIDKPIFEVLPEARGQGFEELLNGVLRTGKPFLGRELSLILNRKGRQDTVYFNLGYHPWRDEQGRISGVIVVANEVSEQVIARQDIESKHKELLAINAELDRALEEKYKLTALLENSTDFIGLATPEGQGVYINPAGLDLTGLDRSHPVLALRVTDFFLEEDLPFVQKTIMPTIREKGLWTGEFRLRHFQTGQAIPVLYNGFTVTDPTTSELIGLATITIDITERKKREAELQRYQKQLTLTNQQLAAANEELVVSNEDLSETNDRLSRLNSDLDNFVYMASHDLRTPIANIEGLVHTLKRHLPPDSLQSGIVQQLMNLMQASIERFKHTLTDLAQIAHLQRAVAEDITELAISEVLEDVRLDLASAIEEAEARLEVDVSGCSSIRFSAKNMRSILYNLLSNAIKYRSPTRKPVVRIQCTATQEYQVLTVSDNGLGMDMTQKHKIFSMFQRLHDHVEGTGLGLYIVKKTIENAGGKIEVESQLGAGSTFKMFFKH